MRMDLICVGDCCRRIVEDKSWDRDSGRHLFDSATAIMMLGNLCMLNNINRHASTFAGYSFPSTSTECRF